MDSFSIRNIMKTENIKEEITEEETNIGITENLANLTPVKTENIEENVPKINDTNLDINQSSVLNNSASLDNHAVTNFNYVNVSSDPPSTDALEARNMLTDIKMESIKHEECDIPNDDSEHLGSSLIKKEGSSVSPERPWSGSSFHILKNILNPTLPITENVTDNSVQIDQCVNSQAPKLNRRKPMTTEIVKQESSVQEDEDEPDCTIIVEENNVRTEEVIKVPEKSQGKPSVDDAFGQWFENNGSNIPEKRSRKNSTSVDNDASTDKSKSEDVIQVLDSDDESSNIEVTSNGVMKPHQIYFSPDTPDVEVIEPEDPLAMENSSANAGQMKINFMGSVTLIDDDETNINQAKNKDKNVLELKYECTYCNKKFARPSYLKKHVRYHTGERPYECTFCHKRFIVRYSLTLHQRIHTNEKPYECSVCQKKFRLAHSLKTHMKIHSTEKRYECTLCNQKFATIHNLKQHSKFHIDVIVE